jgi:hypothetical protein
MSLLGNVILGVLGAITLVLYIMRRRARLRAEEGDSF